MSSVTLLERAFAIAESGKVESVAALREALYQEGYTYNYMRQHMGSRALVRQLPAKIEAAKQNGPCA